VRGVTERKDSNESKIIREADLRKMQDHQKKRQGHGYLRKPKA
jgi:hypothetical protein